MWAIAMHGRNESSNFFEITSVVDVLNRLPLVASLQLAPRGPALGAYILMRK